MNRRTVFGLIGLAASAYAKPAARDRFVGVWKLVSSQRKYNDGRVENPYGDNPVGRIVYDKAGRFSAQLMRPDRHSTVPSGGVFMADHPSAEEIREAARGYFAYFGNFDIDEASTTVIHHVQACLVPSWVGMDQKRAYRLYSNRLALTFAAPDYTNELVWEREPD